LYLASWKTDNLVDASLMGKKLSHRTFHKPGKMCVGIMLFEGFHGRNGHKHVTKGAQAYGQDAIWV
jgi:hypothetical protein